MNNNSLIQFVLISIISLVSLIYFIISTNYEFIIYVIVLFLFFSFVVYSDEKFKYPKIATWGLMIWAVLHMAGGAIYIKGIRLYDLMLLNLIGEPYNIFKYDQFIHLYTYIIVGILIYFIIKKYLKEEDVLTMIFAIFATSGIGAFYEIVEFSTVIMFTYTGVGGFYNLMLDLCFNFLGATIGVLAGKKLNHN